MTASPTPAEAAETSIAALVDATDRLLAAAAPLAPSRGPLTASSLLPDWTVGHVLTHLARNADAQRNLLHWAETGEETPMYRSREAREADIEAGAGRPAGEIVADVIGSAEQFALAVAAFPADRWSAEIRTSAGGPVTADVIPAQRLAEVELHHHDLGVDAGLALLGPDQQAALLAAVLRSYARTRQVDGVRIVADGAEPIPLGGPTPRVTTVVGSAGALAAWLAGRSDGADLLCDGPLPDLPPW